MEKELSEYVFLDGMWLQEKQLLKLAMNVGNFALAEHYLCALLANAVIYGKRDVILKVNEVREFYGVPQIPTPESKDVEDRVKHYNRINHTADDRARIIFQKMSKEERRDVLRRSMSYLLVNYHLFIYTRHWWSVFMVVRDRLEGECLKQTGFFDYAKEITPDNWPKRLRIGENTSKNFGREIDEEDRGEAYYDMVNNPQRELCDTFWKIVKNMILTENDGEMTEKPPI
jgi:hypothetical protein